MSIRCLCQDLVGRVRVAPVLLDLDRLAGADAELSGGSAPARAHAAGSCARGSGQFRPWPRSLGLRGDQLAVWSTEREERNAIAIATNEPFSGWTKTFTDPRLCAADRRPAHLQPPHHRDRRYPGPQELRRHLPDHPPVREEESRPDPVPAQRPAPGRPRPTGLCRADWLHRRPGLLRQATRDRGLGHEAALRQLANRLVGILHGCLKTSTSYEEATACSSHIQQDQQTSA